MKKMLTVLTVLSLSFALLAGGCIPRPIKNAVKKTEKKYAEKEENKEKSHDFDSSTNQKEAIEEFEYEVPENWEKIETQEGFGYETGDAYLAVSISDVPKGEDPMSDEYVRIMDRNMERKSEEFELISRNKTTAAGLEAIEDHFYYKNNGHELWQHDVSFMGKRFLFNFSMVHSTDTPKDYSEDFKKVLKSIKKTKYPKNYPTTSFDPKTNITEKLEDFSFEIPKLWIEKDSPDDGKYYGYHNSSLSVHKFKDLGGSITKKKVQEAYIDYYNERLENLECEVTKPFKLDGKTTVKIKGIFEQSDSTCKLTSVILDTDDGYFAMMLTYPDGATFNYEEDFNKIIKTIHSM